MPDYLVSWEIDIIADNPREAAEKALEIQRRHGSQAVVFKVLNGEADEGVTVDLNEPEENTDG